MCSAPAVWKRRFEASAHYARITGDARPLYPPVMLEELTGKSVLLVGYGAIGKEIERMLAPFHVELVRVARTRARSGVHAVSELDSLLPQAEIVILILPSTAESHHLIGSRQLALMRQGALLVNAARGPIVDTDALVDALHCRPHSRRARRHRSRAAARRPSAVELPQPAAHASRGRIEPAVRAARRAHRRGRTAPLHCRRAAAQCGSSRCLNCFDHTLLALRRPTAGPCSQSTPRKGGIINLCNYSWLEEDDQFNRSQLPFLG